MQNSSEPQQSGDYANAALLNYAMPVRGGRQPFTAFACGLFTSIATLLALNYLARYGILNLIGWHVYIFIPIGAFAAGVVAISGYVIGSLWTGFRFRRSLIYTVFGLQILIFCGVVYCEFWSLHLVHRRSRTPVSFYEYIAATSKYTITTAGGASQSVGEAGIALRVTEVIGFAFACLWLEVPLVTTPYCELCQTYMKTRRLGLLPASLPYRRKSEMDVESFAEYQRLQTAAMEAATEEAHELMAHAERGEAVEIRDAIQSLRDHTKSVAKLPCRIEIVLESCRHCGNGTFRTNLLVGQKTAQTRRLVAETEVAVEVAREIVRA